MRLYSSLESRAVLLRNRLPCIKTLSSFQTSVTPPRENRPKTREFSKLGLFHPRVRTLTIRTSVSKKHSSDFSLPCLCISKPKNKLYNSLARFVRGFFNIIFVPIGLDGAFVFLHQGFGYWIGTIHIARFS